MFLYSAPVDMRRSFDGLHAIARHNMPVDRLGPCRLRVHQSSCHTVKVLYFDRDGWCVWAKRLEAEPFGQLEPGGHAWIVTQLKLLLEGIEVVRQHRYRHTQPVAGEALAMRRRCLWW
ncbi:IS66 family insertion sequence element accessory protein TnpB [Paraburkholderia sp. A1RI-2L]|uniref:IS66 family insertion sequence element accessory protein TnpB n=1 Tax=Paraburkholderia sp. A1RI-2L TaxID=3028367 RepID=UPI003B826AD3